MAKTVSINEAQRMLEIQNRGVIGKWAHKINEANAAFTKAGYSKMNFNKEMVLARILENTQDRINYALKEATQNSMIGPYKRYAIDILTAMVPNLIAFDTVAVQPLNNKTGIINYMTFEAGNTKGSQTAADEFASTFIYTGSNEKYTHQTVDGEEIAASGSAAYSLSLTWKPIVPGTLSIDCGGGVVAVDDGAGTFTGAGVTVGTSSINYSTGALVLNLDAPAAADVVATWNYNNEYGPAAVPEMNLKITSLSVTAQSRKLKALWSFDAAYEMQKEYGMDLNNLLATQAAAEINHEIDVEILNDLITGAFVDGNNPALSWNATPPVGVAQQLHFESLLTIFEQASNRIFQNTKRAFGNFVVVGTNVSTAIGRAPSFKSAGSSSPIGPYYKGEWDHFKVYVNPFYNVNSFCVGYKGQDMFDAGYAYCPYMPVSTTQMLMLDDFQGRQGWATSYGKRMLNNKMYVPGTISGLNNFLN